MKTITVAIFLWPGQLKNTRVMIWLFCLKAAHVGFAKPTSKFVFANFSL